MRHLLVALGLISLAMFPAHAAAQQEAAPLERFVVRIAALWIAGDASALVGLSPADGRIMLETDEARGSMTGRHAVAALRSAFADRETVSARPARVTISGGDPLMGFGELTWIWRERGVTAPRSATLYVGAVWEERGWRVRELRLLQ